MQDKEATGVQPKQSAHPPKAVSICICFTVFWIIVYARNSAHTQATDERADNIKAETEGEGGPAIDFLNSVPETTGTDFFVNSEAERNDEPLLLSFG